jgi:hypothetical protein
MTRDLIAALCGVSAIIGFVLGSVCERSSSRKEREKDASLIEVLRGLVATLSGRRYDDET